MRFFPIFMCTIVCLFCVYDLSPPPPSPPPPYCLLRSESTNSLKPCTSLIQQHIKEIISGVLTLLLILIRLQQILYSGVCFVTFDTNLNLFKKKNNRNNILMILRPDVQDIYFLSLLYILLFDPYIISLPILVIRFSCV